MTDNRPVHRRRGRTIAATLATLALAASGVFTATVAASADPTGTIDAPASIESGKQLFFSGDGCWTVDGQPQATVLLSVDGETETFHANTDGTWFWITPALTPGTVNIEASCDGYAGYIAYNPVAVEVVDNATVAVPTGAADAGQEIDLIGTGWFYNCDCMPPTIEAVLTDGENTWLLGTSDDASLSGWTNFDGELDDATVTIPADLPTGEYQLVVTQGEYHRATSSITINGFVPVSVSAAVSSPSVAAGDTVEVTGTGFVPGEAVLVNLGDETLTTVTASPSGAIAVRVTIPRTTAVGDHEIILIGETSERSASAGLTVTAAVTPPAGGSNGSGTGTGGNSGTGANGSGTTTATGTLAATGAAMPIGLAAAGLALLAGGAFAIHRRQDARA